MVPRVSIIIPVYNRESLVCAAIESALSASRTLASEVVIVDDHSTDGTWNVLTQVTDSRVRPIRMERNGGQSAARNRGLKVAEGVFVKFLDSDDTLTPDHLEAEVKALEVGADIAVSGWMSELRDGSLVESEAPVFTHVIDDVLAGIAVPTSAALYRRRDDWQWDPSLRKLDDWDYFCQAALGATSIVTVPGSAYVLRHHDGPRATDVTMLANAREHHTILRKIENRLAGGEVLTGARKRRLAQYFYKELRVLCLHDPVAFEQAWQHIIELDPSFRPRDEERQKFMRALAGVVGARAAVRIHTRIKRWIGKR